ncbi:uncharacterized protein LOC8261670 [Ricinus communis]|uniref:Late embryogenesis abundant protein, LEA-18 n=1 Tax=Ricinus communis TaxID=3988 RepID=B9T4J9_RICCO|nr:uncharacterized protein LOC8261670 [Ricinus communis]EEF29227.1 conserved hypothetical protein [Ricinus communis]|eukprot:XP_002533168.1 uncharacterized protein LOC8261670 [Ricinus communis]
MEKEGQENTIERKEDINRDQHKKESVDQILPIKDSPYLQYKDLEDYKKKGYGTEGHLQPKPGRGAGATDAPTLSGGSVPREADVSTIDAITSKPTP